MDLSFRLLFLSLLPPTAVTFQIQNFEHRNQFDATSCRTKPTDSKSKINQLSRHLRYNKKIAPFFSTTPSDSSDFSSSSCSFCRIIGEHRSAFANLVRVHKNFCLSRQWPIIVASTPFLVLILVLFFHFHSARPGQAVTSLRARDVSRGDSCHGLRR